MDNIWLYWKNFVSIVVIIIRYCCKFRPRNRLYCHYILYSIISVKRYLIKFIKWIILFLKLIVMDCNSLAKLATYLRDSQPTRNLNILNLIYKAHLLLGYRPPPPPPPPPHVCPSHTLFTLMRARGVGKGTGGKHTEGTEVGCNRWNVKG